MQYQMDSCETDTIENLFSNEAIEENCHTSSLTNNIHSANRRSCNRTMFSQEEDEKLKEYYVRFNGNWKKISKEMKNRSVRQCKERYLHYLSPTIKHQEWSPEEDQLLESKVEEHGKRWKMFEFFFEGRTEIDIRNRYNVLIRRQAKNHRLTQKRQHFLTNSKNIHVSNKVLHSIGQIYIKDSSVDSCQSSPDEVYHFSVQNSHLEIAPATNQQTIHHISDKDECEQKNSNGEVSDFNIFEIIDMNDVESYINQIMENNENTILNSDDDFFGCNDCQSLDFVYYY